MKQGQEPPVPAPPHDAPAFPAGRGLVWYRYGDPEAMMDELAAAIADALTDAVRERRRASLVLPGGSTPRPLYRLLASRPIAWPQVTVMLGDERWVAEDDPASNIGVWKRLVAGSAADAATTVGFHLPAVAHARDALEEVGARLAVVARPFDVVLLGMGTDGHVASLFPGRDLSRYLDLPLLAVPPAPGPQAGGPERISLGLPLLADGRKLILLVRGEEKRRMLSRAIAEGPAGGLPVAHLIARAGRCRAPLEIWWAPADTEIPGADR